MQKQRSAAARKDFSIIEINGLPVQLARKKVKRLSLAVRAPEATVTASAPQSMPLEYIVDFILDKWSWVERQREKMLALPRKAEPDFSQGSLFPIWGELLSFVIIEQSSKNSVKVEGGQILLNFKESFQTELARRLMDLWQKRETLLQAAKLLPGWLNRLGLAPATLKTRHMTSRWGSCRPDTRVITLNAALASRKPVCLEYVLVHELGHFFSRRHGPEFKKFIATHIPDWQSIDKLLHPNPD